MTAIAKKIQREIGELPLEDMLMLHEHLVMTIHRKEKSEPLDSSFRREIRRRIAEIDSREVDGVDALDALKRM